MRVKMNRKIIISVSIIFLLIISYIMVKVMNVSPTSSLTSHGLKPNVMIIVMDTVRQDHLSIYGHKRDTTPRLRQLVKSSRTYYNAYSTSGWTPPAHASLFTGLYPIAHKTTQENWAMSNQLTTLAEIFSAQGYETIGIAENGMLNKKNNFNQGFSIYYEAWKEHRKKQKSFKVRALKKLGIQSNQNIAFNLFKKSFKEINKEKPFFMFVNFMEPHSPYDSSQQFRSQFLSNKSLKVYSNKLKDYLLGKINFSHDELKHLNELYDAEILYVDYWIGEMIDELKERNAWDNTIFIVTSDHGENIGDHSMVDHVFSLYESTIRIPLVIHYPRVFPANSKDYNIVQLTDIFPTLLEMTGIGTEKYLSQGNDISDINHQPERVAFSEYYYPKQVLAIFDEQERKSIRLKKYKRQIRAIISNNMKYIWGSDGNCELYDIVQDPQENDNLLNNMIYQKKKLEMDELVENMVKKYGQSDYIKHSSSLPAPNRGIDKQTIDELKSLGYIQ